MHRIDAHLPGPACDINHQLPIEDSVCVEPLWTLMSWETEALVSIEVTIAIDLQVLRT